MTIRRCFFLAFISLSWVACGDDDATPTEGSQPGQCSDGADNDMDGDFDCRDSDCFGAPACEGTDASVDVGDGPDAGRDAEVTVDGGTDAGPDGSNPNDASADAGVDAGVDAGEDAAPDTGRPPPSVCDEGLYDGALICDGFEGPPMGMPGLAVVDTGDAYRGEASLLARVVSTADRAFFAYSYTFAPTDAPLYARFYLLQPRAYSSLHSPIWFQGADHTIAVITSSGDRTRFFVDRHSGGLDFGGSEVGVPMGRWTCVQIQLVPGEGDGRIVVHYDGALAIDSSEETIPGGHQRVWVGSLSGQDGFFGESVDVRIDDLVVDTSPIACD